MRYITISMGESGYRVHDEGRHTEDLTWGEMLEQVALLTVPPARVGHGYAMHTNAEWLELKARYRKSMTLQDRPPLPLAAPDSLSF